MFTTTRDSGIFYRFEIYVSWEFAFLLRIFINVAGVRIGSHDRSIHEETVFVASKLVYLVQCSSNGLIVMY